MDPGSRVELPPRGADLSLLSNNPETDTPSRWLTFNSTPNGNTTPGTAFGSPFWGSLAAANGQGTSGTPTAGGAGANLHSKLSPKAYSPSKEFNPFELSFFPKHNEHLLAPTTTAGKDGNAASNKMANVGASNARNGDKGTTGDDVEESENAAGNTTDNLSSSVSSLKRPFQDAHSSSDNNISHATSLQSDASSRASAQADDSNHQPMPSWKRPKIEDLHNSNPSSSDLSSTSAYAPSPSNTLNMNNASPDSGSPASSLIPTPSLQHAMLPPNASAGAVAIFGGSISSNNQGRKMSIPPEQIEVAKLGSANGLNGLNGNAVHVHPHLQQGYPSQQGTPLHSGTVPPPLSATYNAQQQQGGGHSYTYTGYMSHTQHQPQTQPQPVILPPKTLQQAQQQQRISSPITAHPPQSARQSSLEQQQQQSPVLENSNTIPYANGRGPARPSRSTRSSANHTRRGSTAPGNAAPDSSCPQDTYNSSTIVKQEEDNNTINMYDSSSGNIAALYNVVPANNDNANNNGNGSTIAGAQGQGTQKATKKGKKNGGRAVSASGSSSGKKGNAASASASGGAAAATGQNENSYSAAGAGDGYGAGGGANGEGGDDDEDGDDEHKRKAFLERNRQAACRSRQKKKEWINNLETHAARLQSENQSLASEIDVLRKELFALRHTLSFHERSGCTAAPGAAGNHQHQPPPSAALQAPVPMQQPVQQQQQQQPRPEWRQQQQPQQQQPIAQPAYQQNMSHPPQAPAIHQSHPSPQSNPNSLHDAQHPHPRPVHIQTQPQPLSARSTMNAGPTLAPSALQGLTLQVNQPQLGSGLDHQHQQQPHQLSSSQRAPPKLNLSPASLQPQSGMNGGLNPHSQLNHLPSHGNSNQLGSIGDINRPGSAGATFGLATPNFADLFNGAMGKLGNGGTTPAFGAGLLFTPGGIMSSGGMLGGGNSSNNNNNSMGYNMSPGLPNTFGLSLQDIPIRPASAPPTPSPALDTRLIAPSQDYFSSKNLSSNLGTSAAFADFLAAYPSNALHSTNAGSVLA